MQLMCKDELHKKIIIIFFPLDYRIFSCLLLGIFLGAVYIFSLSLEAVTLEILKNISKYMINIEENST